MYTIQFVELEYGICENHAGRQRKDNFGWFPCCLDFVDCWQCGVAPTMWIQTLMLPQGIDISMHQWVNVQIQTSGWGCIIQVKLQTQLQIPVLLRHWSWRQEFWFCWICSWSMPWMLFDKRLNQVFLWVRPCMFFVWHISIFWKAPHIWMMSRTLWPYMNVFIQWGIWWSQEFYKTSLGAPEKKLHESGMLDLTPTNQQWQMKV